MASGTHVSPFSGTWYPANPRELERLIEKLFRASAQRTGEDVPGGAKAFVAPHAGLSYSGAVAAALYRHIERRQPERIFVLGFSHHGAPAGIWIPQLSAIETPLGAVEVDPQAVARLAACPEFGMQPEELLCDHSVEIQLPLIQRAAPGARLVPLYVSRPSEELRAAAAARLASLIGPQDVLIASSDFTHYGRDFRYEPFPVDSHTLSRIHDLDEEVMEALGSLRESLLFSTLRETGSTVCGYEPMGLLLATLRELGRQDEIFQEKLDYRTSAEITGELRHSVSYAALGYFPYSGFLLSRDEQEALQASARATLEHYLKTGKRQPIPAESITPALRRKTGAFVSLHRDGELRGCVGQCGGLTPLAETVPYMLLAAALDDTRFSPVSPHERNLEIEISVLTPLKRILSPDDFRVNEHGAVLRAGGRQGLLLPQVARDRNWSAGQFLDALAMKAGVSPSVYKDPATRLYVFRAQVF